MYPIPTNIRMYSPIKTAGGGGIVKKNLAWSAGGRRKESEASITAKTPASFALRRNSETNPASGINNPTVMKNPANAPDRSSWMRVSTPKGVNKKPRAKPSPNKAASIPSALLNDAIVLDSQVISAFSSPSFFLKTQKTFSSQDALKHLGLPLGCPSPASRSFRP